MNRKIAKRLKSHSRSAEESISRQFEYSASSTSHPLEVAYVLPSPENVLLLNPMVPDGVTEILQRIR